MKLQKLLSYTRKAADDFKMINNNDKIAIGISGGKDSMATIIALNALKNFYPLSFEIMGVSVDLGLGADFSEVKAYLESLNIRFEIIKTDIGKIVFDERKEKNPCSLCAKMRKGALNDFVQNEGFNKVALGHNKDDIIETFVMSLLYEGRIHTFSPVTHLSRKNLYSIRPLIYAPESEITSFVRRMDIPIVKSPCPVNGKTKREEIKNLIKNLSLSYKDLDEKLFTAIRNSGIKGFESNSGRVEKIENLS